MLEVLAERRGWRWAIRAHVECEGQSGLVPAPTDAPERVSWIVEPAASLYHLDIPGVVGATVAACEAGAARGLFARTPLLASLGVFGGRHELLSAALIPA